MSKQYKFTADKTTFSYEADNEEDAWAMFSDELYRTYTHVYTCEEESK
mgnify:CR=1 FL=1